MATSATRAPALPALHLQPGSNARSQKCPSASPPFFPTHDGKDARLIGTRLLVVAWQLEHYASAIRSLFGKATRELIKTISDGRRPVLCARAILRYICKLIRWLD